MKCGVNITAANRFLKSRDDVIVGIAILIGSQCFFLDAFLNNRQG
jgi:hypothetical protein